MKKFNVTVTRIYQYTLEATSMSEALKLADPEKASVVATGLNVAEAYTPEAPASPTPDEVEHGR